MHPESVTQCTSVNWKEERLGISLFMLSSPPPLPFIFLKQKHIFMYMCLSQRMLMEVGFFLLPWVSNSGCWAYWQVPSHLPHIYFGGNSKITQAILGLTIFRPWERLFVSFLVSFPALYPLSLCPLPLFSLKLRSETRGFIYVCCVPYHWTTHLAFLRPLKGMV